MIEPKELLSFSDQEVPVCVCLLSCFSNVQLYATLWTATHRAPLSMGFSRQEYWSRLPCPPPEDLPNPGTEPASSALQVASLPTDPPGNPPRHIYYSANSHQNTISTLGIDRVQKVCSICGDLSKL